MTAGEPADSGDSLGFTGGTFKSTDGATVTIAANGNYTYDPTGVAAFRSMPSGQTAIDAFTYTVIDNHDASATGTITISVNSIAAVISSIVATGANVTNGNGDLSAGNAVTLTVNLTAAVTVNTAGGSPTLALNDGGVATYTGGSGSNALTFSYTVLGGQNTSDLAISSFNLNGAMIVDAAGKAADLSAATNYNPAGILQIDTTTPTIASIAAAGTEIANGSGDLAAGNIVTLTVALSEAVIVNTAGGSPTLALNDGGIAIYTGGSGTNTLAFSYTVLSGQNTPDLTVSSLNLNGATIQNGAGTAADLSAATNYNPAGILQIDTTTPTITSITTSGPGITNGNGDLGLGAVVTLTVAFSEAVNVNTAGGSPTLALNDGGLATYGNGSGTNTLTFSYTVLSGQSTPDLTVSSLNLGGATIQNGAGATADLSAATNYNPAGVLQIDPNAPTIASIGTSGAGITSGNGDLAAGSVVTLTVAFSEVVNVNTAGGSPTLALNDGGVATYGSGSGTNSLTFSTTVLSGQNTPDLAVASFNLNGAGIVGAAGTAADLSAATNYNPAGILQIDTTTPAIASIATSGAGITNGNGDLAAGSNVTLAVAFSDVVNVDTTGGSPTLALNDGGLATYSSGSGTSTLAFSYTVVGGQNTPDLTIASFNLNGATMQNGAGTAADVSVATNYNPTGILQIDTTTPAITSIATSGPGITNGSGDLSSGAVVTLTAAFSEAVNVNTTGGSPTLALNDGGVATYSTGSGTNTLTFSYTVLSGQNTPGLTISSLNLNGATIQNGAGTTADLSAATNYSPAGILQIDTTIPAIASIATSGAGIANGNGDLAAGSVVTLTVAFSEVVNVNTAGGSPTLALNDGGVATYGTGSGTNTLTFSTTVLSGQSTPDLTVAAFNLNGATIQNGASTAADLSAATNYNPAGILQIDATTPTIASITTSGAGITNGNGDLAAGSMITLTVIFSEAVNVNAAGGSPTLALNDGGGVATYGSGSGTNTLTFSYTVLSGQNTPDLTVSSLNLNGATIQNGVGTAADLSAATNYNPIGFLQIDTTTPTIASIATSGTGITNGNGDLNAGKIVTLAVSFSEAVNVNTAGGSPTLTLNDGGVATYSSGSGTNTLSFSYTVVSGQNTPDLTVASFNLNGATIQNGAGTAADLSAATNYNPAGLLQIDTTTPTIAAIATSGAGITNGNGDLNAGKVVTLTVSFSEAVNVNTAGGSPTLALNDGGVAAYTGGSGTNALTFSYTVLSGQSTPDLTISSFNLNGATIQNGAGTAANLSAATNYNPAGILQIDTTTPTIASIATSGAGITNGNGDLNAGHVVTLTVAFSEVVNVNTAGGSPTLSLNDGGVATYSSGSGTNTLTFSYTVLSGQNTSDLIVASFNLKGATIGDGAGNAANLAGATNYNPPGTLQIDTTAPTITINTIASNNIINATKAASGFAISGSTSGTENGQMVTVQIINSAHAVVDSYTTADQRNAWSVSVTGAQALALADGSYTVIANVADKAGNPAPQATHALTVDEDKSPEPPALTLGSSSLFVAAGGSIPLGITATPVDSDDRLSLTISGVPSYETITAPSGDNVSRQLQLNGTYTWTITETSSAAGKPISGLTLKSNYTGTGQPTSTFTITASNITSGETAASLAQTMSVTDPPQIASGSSLATALNTASHAAFNHLAFVFDQFIAAGFHSSQPGAGSITPPAPAAAIGELPFITQPQH